jgi:hypothetical protein
LKLVQERAENKLKLIDISNDFLNRTQITQQLREIIDKWEYIKLQSFCKIKEIISKLKRLSTEWEIIFASCTSDKEPITTIYREVKTLNSPKINDPLKKCARELNRVFSNEEIQVAKKHEKKYSTSLALKEIQIFDSF